VRERKHNRLVIGVDGFRKATIKRIQRVERHWSGVVIKQDLECVAAGTQRFQNGRQHGTDVLIDRTNARVRGAARSARRS